MRGGFVDHHAHSEVLKHFHTCPECLLQDFGGDDLSRRAIRDDAVIDAHQMRKVRGHAVEVVRGEHDGNSVFVKVGEQVENIVTRGDVDAAGGFVHEHELWAPKERSREEHALLLPAGEFADVTLG